MKNCKGLVMLVVVAGFFSSCKNVKAFEFKRVESWKIKDLGFTSGSVAAHLVFYNPNKFPVTLQHMEGNVAIEGREVGVCTSDTTIRFAARQEYAVPVDISLKTGSMLMGGLSFLSQDSLLIRFTGFAHVGRAGFFINYKFDSESKVATKF